MSESYDVVVVGGGIAGGALATVLARDGFTVLVLEREIGYRDRVRGEYLAPWGVEEARRLGLEQVLLDAGGWYTSMLLPFDEVVEPIEAASACLLLDGMLPGVAGAVDVGHPELCAALAAAGAAAGATVRRGVRGVQVGDGTVGYALAGTWRTARSRLVVGADGAASLVRRQLAIDVRRTRARTMGGGMLVDGLDRWPSRQICRGTEGDLHFVVLPRAGGRARLYLVHDIRTRRFAGRDCASAFRAAWRFACIPDGWAFAAARPAGPCALYPFDDGVVDEPYAPGAVLVGDAAGWNDPIAGQGLSIALRDVRLVTEILRAGRDWSVAAFAPYGAERRERMRRLRLAAALRTELYATFTPDAAARRRAWKALWPADPVLGGPELALLLGPEKVAAESFGPDNLAWARVAVGVLV